MGDSPDTSDSLPWATDGDPSVSRDAKISASDLEAEGQAGLFGDTDRPDKATAPEAQADIGRAPNQSAQVSGGGDAPGPAVTAQGSQPYRVLARKYRPQTFSQLIGQDAMVRTLANAIKRDRLAHAFLMTGVRGVGKTSTARLIAKALNCVGPDGTGGPTIDPCGVCEPCVAIAEGRHIDVIEMDAASNTGIDDVREIIEAVRYAAVSARYKIYIIDEAHMLSKQAWNGLLKTLEEPPAHVKFLFATTEAEKLLVTILSRTQRFDLRRIPADMLAAHFAEICKREDVSAEPEALELVAAAAEGSVRDGLSILDQAIAHADLDGGNGDQGVPMVTAARMREMLGLADKRARRRLFAHLLDADAPALLAALDEQYSLGVEPLALMRSLLDLVHRVTVAQIGGTADAPGVEERAELVEWGQRLSAPQLHRLWQLLLKGHGEVRDAPDPLAAARMALLRALHAADLPDPGKLARTLETLAAAAPLSPLASAGEHGLEPAATAPPDLATLATRLEEEGHPLAASVLRMQVRPIGIEPGKLRYSRAPGFTGDIAPLLRDALRDATGDPWQLEEVTEGGTASLVERDDQRRADETRKTRNHPLVSATLAAFPEAEMIDTADTVPSGARQWRTHA